jgi:iron complex outermembrane recepter protein
MFETNPKVTRTSKYTDWFPSIVFKYQFTPALEWQVGVNKAIARPAIGDITGLWTINDNANPPTVTAANANLQPEYHKVYQTRLAYYFGGRSPGQVSIAYIQDEARNFVVTKNYTAEEFGVTDPDFSGYTFISKTNEVALQRYKNFDFNYNQTLGFLPSEYLRGISIGGTYSRSYANQRRQKLAPNRVTARLGYTYRRFSTSIGMIWIDDRPIDSVYGRIWGAMTKLDLSATFKLNKYATLFMQARNPTNQKDLFYESPPGVQEGKQRTLRKQEEYGDNWVFGIKGMF